MRLSVAGRTDAGVHAAAQVASFGAGRDVDPARVQRATNGMLAPEVVVTRARRAAAGFDARRSATARVYRYRIETGPWPSPFDDRFVWHRPRPLAVGAMRTAARALLGSHDFASFCRRPPRGSSTVRDVRRIAISTLGTRVDVTVEANAFLHQMVRSIVGTLVTVGDGTRDPSDLPGILAARSRAAAGPVAPPHGLTLVRVRYGRAPM